LEGHAIMVCGRHRRSGDSLHQEQFHVKRMGATTIEVDASHSIAASQPDAVAELIRSAVGTLS